VEVYRWRCIGGGVCRGSAFIAENLHPTSITAQSNSFNAKVSEFADSCANKGMVSCDL